MVEKLMNSTLQIFFDDIPGLFEETSVEPIYTRSFIIIHPKKRLFDFFTSDVLDKVVSTGIIKLRPSSHYTSVYHLKILCCSPLKAFVKLDDLVLDFLGAIEPFALFVLQLMNTIGCPSLLYRSMEGLWDVQKDGSQSDGCFLQVFVNVAFSKKTMFKGKIEQSTMEECREVYATWIQLAHELLKQKNIEKGESSIPNMLQDGLIDPQVTGQSVEHSDTNVQHQRINAVANKSRGTHEQTGNSLLENLLHVTTTVMSTLRAFAGKFCNPLKNHPQLFLVIAFSAILLLMQLSIVVLLSRPQPVYVIPQVDQMSSAGHGAGHRAAETVAWMEKRVHLLKDEMLLVESQLERMRHEHILLKSQLKDLERLYKQQI